MPTCLMDLSQGTKGGDCPKNYSRTFMAFAGETLFVFTTLEKNREALH